MKVYTGTDQCMHVSVCTVEVSALCVEVVLDLFFKIWSWRFIKSTLCK